MKASELREAIVAQTQERARHLGMSRDALPHIVCEEGFATIVTGVRRSGKSTLLNQWAEAQKERVAAVHFDDLRLSSFETSDFAVLDAVVANYGSLPFVMAPDGTPYHKLSSYHGYGDIFYCKGLYAAATRLHDQRMTEEACDGFCDVTPA